MKYEGKLDYLLASIGDFGQDVEQFGQIFEVKVILGGTKREEVKEVLLVIRCHVKTILLEYVHECFVCDKVGPPIIHLALAFESESVKFLRVDTMSLQESKNSSK